MFLITIPNHKRKPILSSLKAAISFIILALFSFSLSVQANEVNKNLLKSAEVAIKNNNYQQAQVLFKQLTSINEFKTEALFGLAKVAFFKIGMEFVSNQRQRCSYQI